METPYRVVKHEIETNNPMALGRTLGKDLTTKRDKVLAEAGTIVDEDVVKAAKKSKIATLPVRPYVGNGIEYFSADDEDRYVICQANARLDELGQFVDDRVSARHLQKFLLSPINRVHYIDVAPRQVVGISAALIPFLEHDDANRALMDLTCNVKLFHY